MVFAYPDGPHLRKHGPAGYDVYTSYKPWLRDDFSFRCVYCLERERWNCSGDMAFGVDHVFPKSRREYGMLVCDYENLVYACNRCNSAKRELMVLNPCTATLGEHVRVVVEDGTIVGATNEGNDLIRLLGLNKDSRRKVRLRYLRIKRLYDAQPNDPEIRALYLDCFGYPDDLPDLGELRPSSNSRPGGLSETFFRQRREGRLAETYF